MARCCNSLLQKIWNILKSPIQGTRSSSEAPTSAAASHPPKAETLTGRLAGHQTNRWNSWTQPLDWPPRSAERGHNQFLKHIFLPIYSSWDTEERGGLAVPCGAEIGRYHLLKYYKSTVLAGHTTACLIPSIEAERSIMAAKRWHAGKFHHVTFDLPGFPNRLFLSSGPNKMHYLAGICCSAASTNLSSTSFIWRSSTLI